MFIIIIITYFVFVTTVVNIILLLSSFREFHSSNEFLMQEIGDFDSNFYNYEHYPAVYGEEGRKSMLVFFSNKNDNNSNNNSNTKQ